MKKPAVRWMAAALAAAVLSGCGAGQTGGTSASSQAAPGEANRLQVVAANFPCYDFARAAGGGDADVTMLLPPGAESHSYEPTPQDILAVQGCDLFLYVGGESDAWVDTILDSLDTPVETLKLLECVDTLNEETLEGMTDREEHGEGVVTEIDEHVWTDPANAAKITRAVGARLGELDGAGAAAYQANAEAYAGQIDALDREFSDFFAAVSNRTMVFGDRFPLRYFAQAYDISCYAAFPGCSTQTEPSAATVAYLTQKVEQEHLGTVYYIEFSNHLVADSIAEAAGAQTALFHSCHNVSRRELDDGATYLSLMEGNLRTLQETMG